MDSTDIDGLPLDRAPVDDLDGCPIGWDALGRVSDDDIDGVPLGVAIDNIDGIPCESTRYRRSCLLTSSYFPVPDSSVWGQYTTLIQSNVSLL